MVISFSVKEARDQLLNKEIVYTYRWTRRSFFRHGSYLGCQGKIEYTWANEKRGGKKITDVKIEEIGEMPLRELLHYVDKSGFKTIARWQNKILEQANPAGFVDGWLYRVVLSKFPKKSAKEV